MKHEATLPHRVQRVRQRFQHHRFKDGISIDESSDHRITKKRKKNSATCLHSGKGNEISKRGAKEAGGTRWKNRSVAFAVRPRRWQHLTKRSRVADGGRTRIDGRVFVVFPFFFFSLAYLSLSLPLPLSPATLFDRLSRTARGPSILS